MIRKLYGIIVLVSFTVKCDINEGMLFRPVLDQTKNLICTKKHTAPICIAITGCSGVGKTTFTQKLAKFFEKEGIKTSILKFDDFLDPNHNDKINFHKRFIYQDAHDTMQKILKGEKVITKPTWNPHGQPRKIKENYSINGVDLIICEGEFTFCKNKPYDFKPYMSLGIFVDADDENIIEWDWIRGKVQKERRIPERTKGRFARKRRPELKRYRKYIESVRIDADYVVMKDNDHSYVVYKKLS